MPNQVIMELNNNNIKQIIKGIDFDKLKAHPNILIAAEFWDEDRFDAAKTCYKFMRMVDDLIDDRKAAAEAFSCLEKEAYTNRINDWMECLHGIANGNPFILEVIEALDKYQISISYFNTFAKSMLYDINHDGFDTFDDFLEYAEGASNGPASVFVHLCALKRINGTFILPELNISDVSRPCAIFSYLVHIIRDFEKDQKSNLNYFALDILTKHDLTPEDLKRIAAEGIIPQNFRNMIAEYVSIIEKYRMETERTLDRIAPYFEPEYLFSLRLIFDLYLQIFERIDIENGNFTQEELVPTIDEVKRRVYRMTSRMTSCHQKEA